MTPQKEAWYLFVVYVLIAGAVISQSIGIDWLMLTMLIMMLAIGAFGMIWDHHGHNKAPIKADERDKMIRNKATKYQLIITLTILAVSALSFMTRYQNDSQVSVNLVWWMFWAIIAAAMIARPVCIIIAYWRENRHGE